MRLGEVCLETNDVRRLADFYRKVCNINTECDSSGNYFRGHNINHLQQWKSEE